MPEHNDTPKIDLRIKKEKEKFSVAERKLKTSDGQNFSLQEITGFINLNDAIELANIGPLLIKSNVEIIDSKGTWGSKEPILLVVAHGFRVSNTHLITVSGSSLPSDQVMKSIVRDRETRKEAQRVKLFVSCDNATTESRWDDGQLARTLGIIGFSGDVNRTTTRAEEEMFIIDGRGLNSPFENPDHENRWLVDPKLSPFKRKNITV